MLTTVLNKPELKQKKNLFDVLLTISVSISWLFSTVIDVSRWTVCMSTPLFNTRQQCSVALELFRCSVACWQNPAYSQAPLPNYQLLFTLSTLYWPLPWKHLVLASPCIKGSNSHTILCIFFLLEFLYIIYKEVLLCKLFIAVKKTLNNKHWHLGICRSYLLISSTSSHLSSLLYIKFDRFL